MGDRLSLFGSPIPTAILMSLAGRGWTFEAICCEVATGYDRVVVKKAIRRLEAEGVLEGSRPRGPGFGPRLLRIADAFPARDELQALIDAIPTAWPDLGDRIEGAFGDLPEKTRVYFRNRGMPLQATKRKLNKPEDENVVQAWNEVGTNVEPAVL